MTTIIGTYPYTLQNGQAEDANQVMSNFAWILSQINGFNWASLASGGNAVTANVLVTGNIWGANWTVSGTTHNITVTAYSCMDAVTNSVQLYSSSTTTITLPSVASTWYCICAVRTTGGVQQVNIYTSEANAAADASINAYRILGWWYTLSTTYAATGTYYNGMLQFDDNQLLIGSDSYNNPGSTKTTSFAVTGIISDLSRVARVFCYVHQTSNGGDPSNGCSTDQMNSNSNEVDAYITKGYVHLYLYSDTGLTAANLYLHAIWFNR